MYVIFNRFAVSLNGKHDTSERFDFFDIGRERRKLRGRKNRWSRIMVIIVVVVVVVFYFFRIFLRGNPLAMFDLSRWVWSTADDGQTVNISAARMS